MGLIVFLMIEKPVGNQLKLLKLGDRGLAPPRASSLKPLDRWSLRNLGMMGPSSTLLLKFSRSQPELLKLRDDGLMDPSFYQFTFLHLVSALIHLAKCSYCDLRCKFLTLCQLS